MPVFLTRSLRTWLISILLIGLLGIQADEIKEYNTTITVNQSGTLIIVEKLQYDFGTASRHGIFRDIPLTIKVPNSTRTVPLGLSEFSVESDGASIPFVKSEMDSSSSGRIVRLKIGDPDATVTGLHKYTISYGVKRGVMPSDMSDMEAIRWNVVGSGSNIPTLIANAELILPDSLSEDIVYINSYTGEYGSRDSDAAFKWIDAHRVRFVAHNLPPHEALTIEANYPKGLLAQSADEITDSWLDSLMSDWHWGALVGFFLFLWNYARRFGAHEDMGSITPQYYPPKGLSLLQSGLIIDKFADKEDFAAAALELGSMGYLEIRNSTAESTPVLKRTTKSGDASTLTTDQRYLLDGILFADNNTYAASPQQDTESASALDSKLSRLNELLYNWSVSSGQMRTNPERSRNKFLLTAGSIAAVLGFLAVISTVKYYGVDVTMVAAMGALFVGIGIFVLLSSIKKKAYGGILFGAMWLAVSSFGFGSMFVDMGNIVTILSSPIVLLPIVAIMTWYFYRKVGIFTPKGLDTYRYLLGYKEFMQRVERDKIRRFLKNDPEYLDRGLPYAVLFGVNEHWLKLYQEMNIEQPVWYYGDIHSVDNFTSAMDRQSVAPVSESGGFSGGGSFSGGGGGGGGVGSW